MGTSPPEEEVVVDVGSGDEEEEEEEEPSCPPFSGRSPTAVVLVDVFGIVCLAPSPKAVSPCVMGATSRAESGGGDVSCMARSSSKSAAVSRLAGLEATLVPVSERERRTVGGVGCR